MRKMELSRHPGKAKEKSYLINDDTTKTKFFHVKFMEKLLNRDLVRLFFETDETIIEKANFFFSLDSGYCSSNWLHSQSKKNVVT